MTTLVADISPLPGQYFDQESSLHYNYFRDYDPKTGRYIEPDPIGIRGGINLFGYANQNPLKYTDPTGEYAIAVPVLECLANPACIGPLIIITSQMIDQFARNFGRTKPKGSDCPDDDDQCDKILDKGLLKSAGIFGKEHAVKEDALGTGKGLSKFDLCGCKDGRVVVKLHGCKGPIISGTPYRWK
jgi:RHS repeat-associated protein